MPKRTNPFQSLVMRIQKALHGTRASVEESAFVTNHVTGSKNEIDILVSFEVGGYKYRAAIECQDRSRPADPTWIRSLRTLRDDCHLDKMIAVHARGFTKAARRTAKHYNIDCLSLAGSSETEWRHTLIQRGEYRAQVAKVLSWSKHTVDLDINELPNPPPEWPDTTIQTPGFAPMSFTKTLEQMQGDVSREAMKILPPNVAKQDRECITLEFRARYPAGTTISIPGMDPVRLSSIGFLATVEVTTFCVPVTELLAIGESVAADTLAEIPDGRLRVTLTATGGDRGMYMEYRDLRGADVKKE